MNARLTWPLAALLAALLLAGCGGGDPDPEPEPEPTMREQLPNRPSIPASRPQP